jgi:hypothetical protein
MGERSVVRFSQQSFWLSVSVCSHLSFLGALLIASSEITRVVTELVQELDQFAVRVWCCQREVEREVHSSPRPMP